jgi:tetratricopeptide (TPR) repeat protein
MFYILRHLCVDETLDPIYTKAWNGKGNSLNDQGKYNEAIKAYDEAIELDPKYAKAWNNNGLSLKALGRTAESNAALAKAKELRHTG